MKLAYFALTAATIAIIGAVGMNSSGRKSASNATLATNSHSEIQNAYKQLLKDKPPIRSLMQPAAFGAVKSAQAQETSGNLRNLPEDRQSTTTDKNNVSEPPARQSNIASAKKPAGPNVDESALRYFAQQGDLERLQAEISRLRSLYPNWSPPANPLAIEDGTDTQLNTMWDAYAKGDYAKVEELIQQRKQDEPDWSPPADLVNRVQIAETRQKLLEAAKNQNYPAVIDLASKAPSLLTCAEINVLWQVGEAFAKTDKLSRAVDDYTYILKNCDKPAERLATMQKAMALLPYDDVKNLLSYDRKDDAGNSEFQEINDALLRNRMAEAGKDKTITISPDDLAQMETLANTTKDPDDAQLMAWYFLIRNSDAAAEEWFRKARKEGDSATISQGLALILIEQNKASEAEAIMYPWRDASDEATDTYLSAVIKMLTRIPRESYSEDVLKRMAEVVTKTKSVTAARQFGWYSNDLGQPFSGLQWFEAALSWEPWDESAAYGVTMMLNTMNYRTGVFQMQKVWAPYSERIAWLYDPNAPVATLEDLKATVFQLTAVKQTNGKTRTVAVPIALIDMETGTQTPLGGGMAAAPADTAMTAGGQPSVALTAPRYAPGTMPPAGEADQPDNAPVNYVPEYYKYFYEQNATTPASGSAPLTGARSLESLTIPRSMIKTDPVTGIQTVTVLDSLLQPNVPKYIPPAAQIRQAFYTTGQPSEKTVIFRFDEQAYLNRDYLRQFVINDVVQTGAANTADQLSVSTLPAGTPLPAGVAVDTTTSQPARTTTTTRRSSSSGSSSSGSCWSGRSPDGLSPDSALRQGWCLMDLERPMEAAKSFERALASSASKTREEAAYGQGLAYMRLGLDSKAAVSASQAPMSRDRQLDLQVQLLTNRAIAAYQGGHYNDALLLLSQRDQLAPLETGLLVIRGYAYYNLNRYFDARQVFEALAEMGDRKGMEGLALTNKALSMPNSN